MRVRLRPNGRRQPYFAVRVPGTWDELLKIARERLSSDPSVGGVRLYLPDGAEVFSLDDVDTDDVLAVAFNDAEFEQLGTYTGPSPPSPSPHPPTRPPLPLPPPPPWPLPPMPMSPHPSFPPPQLPPSLLPSSPPELPPWMPPLPHAHIARSPPSSLPSTVTPNFVNTSSVVNASIRQRESAASAPHNSTADAARPDGKLVFNRSSRADANHSHPATLNFSAVALGRVANTTSGTDNDVASVLGALLLLAFGLAAMMSALFVFKLGTNQTGAHSPWLEEVSEDEYGEKDEGAENNPFPLAVELRPNRGKVPSTLVGRAHFYWLRLQQVALSASETSLTIEKAKYGEVPSGCSPAEQSVEMSGPKYETIE